MFKSVVVKEKSYGERKTVQGSVHSYYEQQSIINQMYITECSEYSTEEKVYANEIKKKINGYISQDKKKVANPKRRYVHNEEDELTFDIVLEKLMLTKLICFYCRTYVVVIYKDKLDKRQWTLDRIDNTVQHSGANCVISCLECNMKRRTQNCKRFKESKQILNIIKEYT